MEDQQNLTPVQQALTKAKSILVLIPQNPNIDKVASALALYLSFKKQGKQAVIACPSPMTVGFNRLFSVDKIQDKIGNRNLIISFDYQKDSIEKVSYNIENNKFNLVIEPRTGQLPLNQEKVSYSYSGSESDLVFIIGALKLEELEKLYFNEKKTYENALTVNVDYRSANTRFGKLNLIDPQSTSCSEIVSNLIKKLNLAIDQEVVSNLLAGIEANSNNFQNLNVSPNTFEMAAWCLKNGAKRGQLKAPQLRQPVRPQPPFTAAQPPFVGPQPTKPVNRSKQPPPDWFKPKIYKGQNLV